MRTAAALVLFVAACGGDTNASDAAGPPPSPSGCIADVGAGDHTLQCDGLQVDDRIPAACESAGCGLILLLHGDTGTGLLMDAHVRLRDLGEQHGYIVVAPTGPAFGQGLPGSTWHPEDDVKLVDIVAQYAEVFRVDRTKIHVAGFSRGGFVTWRLVCDHADLFASAAPGGAGDGTAFGEATCFSQGRAPSRPIPLAFLMGKTDAAVGFQSMVTIRDAAIAAYGASGPVVVAQDDTFVHQSWSGGAIIETFEHDYATVPDGPWGDAQGHCIPGSAMDPYAPQYAIPCAPPNSFTWGDEIMTFFLAHPGT